MLELSEFRFCPRCATAMIDQVDSGRTRRGCPKCGFIFYGNPLPVVAAIVERNGQVVLVRNKGWPAKIYGIVSGFLEAGESPQEGALREVKEELGLDATMVSLIGVYPFEMKNEVCTVFHVKADAGEIAIGDELEAFKEMPIEKLKPWRLGTGLGLRDWLTGRGLNPPWLGE